MVEPASKLLLTALPFQYMKSYNCSKYINFKVPPVRSMPLSSSETLFTATLHYVTLRFDRFDLLIYAKLG
jgi:hypothetical protein